jgi:hypothetical protein
MAQDLTVNIKTTSDVPQAVDRAKEAITSLEKRASGVKAGTTSGAVEQTTTKATSGIGSQFDKIGKSFGNTISSVFLSFAGPLAIISGIIGFIGNSIADAKQLAEDGLNRIAEGKSKLNTAEETKMANFFKAKDAREKEEKEVKAGREEMTLRFLRETEEGKKIMAEAYATSRATLLTGESDMSQAADIQKIALDAFLKSPEGKRYASMFDAEKATKENSFRAPEGFSNVVGVGANPVLQAMDEALTESKKQTGLLEQIATTTKVANYDDFTKQGVNANRAAASMAGL